MKHISFHILVFLGDSYFEKKKKTKNSLSRFQMIFPNVMQKMYKIQRLMITKERKPFPVSG